MSTKGGSRRADRLVGPPFESRLVLGAGQPKISWDQDSLRYMSATGWIRSGVSVTETSHRLGHTTEVLLKAYTGLLRGDLERANERISTWLNAEW